jgi:hypothetical protein
LKLELPRQENSVYDHLTRDSLAKWFISLGELKDDTK